MSGITQPAPGSWGTEGGAGGALAGPPDHCCPQALSTTNGASTDHGGDPAPPFQPGWPERVACSAPRPLGERCRPLLPFCLLSPMTKVTRMQLLLGFGCVLRDTSHFMSLESHTCGPRPGSRLGFLIQRCHERLGTTHFPAGPFCPALDVVVAVQPPHTQRGLRRQGPRPPPWSWRVPCHRERRGPARWEGQVMGTSFSSSLPGAHGAQDPGGGEATAVTHTGQSRSLRVCGLVQKVTRVLEAQRSRDSGKAGDGGRGRAASAPPPPPPPPHPAGPGLPRSSRELPAE